MPVPFVDTDVIIRLLTGDDPVKQAQAVVLFEQVEQAERRAAQTASVMNVENTLHGGAWLNDKRTVSPGTRWFEAP